MRKTLSNNVLDEFRKQFAGKRDVRRERHIAKSIEPTSVRLESFIRDYGPAPDQAIVEQKRAITLLLALEELPESQRQAITLQMWHNRSLQEIADLTGKTKSALAGLLKRGLQSLREELKGKSDF